MEPDMSWLDGPQSIPVWQGEYEGQIIEVCPKITLDEVDQPIIVEEKR